MWRDLRVSKYQLISSIGHEQVTTRNHRFVFFRLRSRRRSLAPLEVESSAGCSWRPNSAAPWRRISSTTSQPSTPFPLWCVACFWKISVGKPWRNEIRVTGDIRLVYNNCLLANVAFFSSLRHLWVRKTLRSRDLGAEMMIFYLKSMWFCLTSITVPLIFSKSNNNLHYYRFERG